MVLRVSLVSRGGEEISNPPGRDLLVRADHAFAALATAIDRAFARWDLSHLHEFRLPDGRRIGAADADELGEPGERLDERKCTLGNAEMPVGGTFEYVFDFGDGWEHSCTLLRDNADPLEEYSGSPNEIVPIFGWGTIPDQYARIDPADADA